MTNVEFQVAAAEALPFASGSFDIVTCRIAPHHFQDVPAFLSESYRVLRTSGLFCMIDTVCPESERLIRWQNRVEKLGMHPTFGRTLLRSGEDDCETGFKIERESQSKNADSIFMVDTAGNEVGGIGETNSFCLEELSTSEGTIYDIRRDGEELSFVRLCIASKLEKRLANPYRRRTFGRIISGSTVRE